MIEGRKSGAVMQVIFIKNNSIIYKQQNKHTASPVCALLVILMLTVSREVQWQCTYHLACEQTRDATFTDKAVWCDLASFTAAVNQVD